MTQQPHSIPDEARSADADLTSAPDTLLDEAPEGLPGEPDNVPDTLPDEPSEALPGEAPEVQPRRKHRHRGLFFGLGLLLALSLAAVLLLRVLSFSAQWKDGRLVVTFFGADSDYVSGAVNEAADSAPAQPEQTLPRAATGTGVTMTLTDAPAGPMTLQALYRAVSPSVVSVLSTVEGQTGSGSGIIMTGDGYVAGIYKRYGKVISPMGCRAFLSPWFERGGMKPADDADEPVFVGRFNIGAVSLHLPMIYAKAQKESRDFYEVLDYYLELIRKLHLRTYEYLGEMRASTNPLAYCEGGFYGGHLGIHDKIKPLLASATASFGITALNELQQLHNHKSLVEDGRFAIEVMEHINEKVAQFKEEDGRLYAMYGTPAESLCGLQVEQFRKKYGIVENVSDRPYVSNSFHCHVSEEITPSVSFAHGGAFARHDAVFRPCARPGKAAV